VTDDASVVRARAASVLEAGEALRASTLEERAHWLSQAAITLARQAEDGRDALSSTTGLSIPMLEWAVRTTLDTMTGDAMRGLAQSAQKGTDRAPDPIAMLSVVLAGNVFTASVRGILVPLLFGVPVLVKASSSETLFPAMLCDALRSADSRLGAAMSVVVFPGGDVEREAALIDSAEAVSVYGGDATVEAMAARLGNTPLIAHGHGVSVAYCGNHAIEEAHIGHTISSLSLDICAYDQRGCLSPQLVYVEESSELSVMDFAERLAKEGLTPLSRTLPRGPLPVSVGAAQAQWRGVAEVEGSLVRGDTYAVSVRESQPIRWSPGFRNVTVTPVRALDEALQAMRPIGSNLKCVGADSASIPELEARLASSPTLSAYACTIGTMQTPSLDAPADGYPIWHGLFRT
jgi:acyl-CoA reductase-like NAD-dependent aldehyde dehydrogenase